MGKTDSKKDSKKDSGSKKESSSRKDSGPRKNTGPSSKDASSSRSKAKDVPSSSRHKSERDRGVDIPSRKGKEKATGEHDYYGASPATSEGFAAIGAGAQFSEGPQATITEEEDDIELGNEQTLAGSYNSRIQTAPQSGAGIVDGTYNTSYGNQQYAPASVESNVQSTDGLSNSIGTLRMFDPNVQETQYQLPREERSTVMSPFSATITINRGQRIDNVDSSTHHSPGSRRTNLDNRFGGQNENNGPLAPVPLTDVDRQKKYQRRHKEALMGKNVKLHHSSEFQEGRVLRMYWFEPPGAGQKNVRGSKTVASGGSPTLYRKAAPGKWRRFIIIKTRRGQESGGSSTAIPINTYRYQGTTKSGCHPNDHAMIYTIPWNGHRPLLDNTTNGPPYLPGEMELRNPKIRMDPEGNDELLDKESRINYAKSYNIEHNYAVTFIGWIAPDSQDAFWSSLTRVNSANTYSPTSYPTASYSSPPPPLPAPPATPASSSAAYSPGWQQSSSAAPRSYQNNAVPTGGSSSAAYSPGWQQSTSAAPRSYQNNAVPTGGSSSAAYSPGWQQSTSAAPRSYQNNAVPTGGLRSYPGQTQSLAVASYAPQSITYATGYSNSFNGQGPQDPNDATTP